MKPSPWLYPGVAVLITSAWVGFEKQSAATLEHETHVLTQRIQQARMAEENAARAQAAEEKLQKEKKIDWKGYSRKLAQMGGGGMMDVRSMLKLQNLLIGMTAEELLAQLDEIDELDLPYDSRSQMEAMILDQLGEKNPQGALLHLMDRKDRLDFIQQNSSADLLAKWAAKDRLAAIAWFDQAIKEGKFDSKSLDGKSKVRLAFERSLMNTLLASDPQTANARIASLPMEQREELLQNNYMVFQTGEAQKAYGDILRANLSADQARKNLANIAGSLSYQGYDKVDDFITHISATAEEKASIVEQVMNQQVGRMNGGEWKPEKLEKARVWASTHAPAQVDTLTGKALGRMANYNNSSAQVIQYLESTGNDEMMVAFLTETWDSRGKMLIEKIKDPALREQVSKIARYKDRK